MSTTEKSVEELRMFNPLSDLSYDKLLEIVDQAEWLHAKSAAY